MGKLTPAVRAHLWRLVRLPAFTAAAAALIAPLLQTYTARVPAIGAIVALLEVIATSLAAPSGGTSSPAPAHARTPPA